MKIKSVYRLLFAAAVVAATAQAQQVVSYFAEIPCLSPGSPEILQVPAFDANLGSLTRVKLSYSGEIWQSVFGENTGDTESEYDFTTTAMLKLARVGGPVVFASPSFALKRKGKAGAFDGEVNFADNSGVHFTQHVVTKGVYVDPDLARYVGAHPIDFSAFASSTELLNAHSKFASGASLSTAASLQVEYTFTAIPEPTSYAALMGGAVLLVARWWRRRLVAA